MLQLSSKRIFCKKIIILLSFLINIISFSHVVAAEQSKKMVRTRLSIEEATKIATEAYIYGYPLVTMDMTRRIMTNVPGAQESRAPMAQFANMRTFPNAKFKDITAPNTDTLYSVAWLDLRNEPYVLHIPNEEGRYFLMPLLSAWSNIFASLGTRTDTKESNLAIVGPNWKGTLPNDVKKIQAPTNLVWILGRTYTDGSEEDNKKVQAIQDKYTITPLSSWGATYVQPSNMPIDASVDMKTPTRDQVNKMDAATFYRRLAVLIKSNPPAKEDAAMVKKLTQLGIITPKNFDIGKLDPLLAKALRQGLIAGQKQIIDNIPKIGTNVNGWQFSDKLGTYGNNYLLRASTAYAGLGANLSKDAIYPMTTVDSAGKVLDSKNKYVIHFDKDALPPVHGFWSLTLYDDKYYLVENKINRYDLGSRDKLVGNPDGSLDFYIQKKSPGRDKETNWLPTPQKGPFILMLRLYWPKEAVLKGKWKMPAVKEVIEK